MIDGDIGSRVDGLRCKFDMYLLQLLPETVTVTEMGIFTAVGTDN
jgi:hypothetical protein